MDQSSSKYIPATPDEIGHMLEAVGFSSLDALLDAAVPADQRLVRPLDLPGGQSEAQVVEQVSELAAANTHLGQVASFLGAGAYRHYVPAVIHHLAGRGEYLTAYTPYQPEVAQGTLQAIFEFQTMVCELLDMEVANASTYDGASALAEALFMAHRVAPGRKPRAILAGAIHPEFQEVCCTYTRAGVVQLVPLAPSDDGRIDLGALDALLDAKTCCVAVQSPNFYGLLEDLPAIAQRVHAAKALLVVAVSDPHACALFQAPGQAGADIVVGEGQALGLPLAVGGPYVGLFAARKKLVRQMPGRLVGCTQDVEGRRGFVLTLATREQHIRREKATSNICTNQGLCALQTAMYMSLLGPAGLRQVAERSHAHALHLKRAIDALPGYRALHQGPFFHEFVVETPIPAAQLVSRLARQGIFAGLPLSRYQPDLSHQLLVCATELNTRAQMDALVAAMDQVAAEKGGEA